MSDFRFKRLKDVARINMGQSPDSSSYNDEDKGLPFLQGCADFGKTYPDTKTSCYKPNKIGKKGSILISVRAPVGVINKADKDYCIGRGLASIDGDTKEALTEFIFYSINLNRGYLDRVSQGSTFSAIGSTELNNMPIGLPPVLHQRKIAEILSTVDEQIEQTEALIGKYQAMKKGMMQDLFSRGVDKNGKLRPPYKTAPHLYKPSELGMIPKEWEVKQCSDICTEIVVGIVIKPTQYYVEWGIPALRSANIRESGIDPSDLVYISYHSNQLLTKSMIHKGNLVTVRTGYPGTTAVVNDEFDGANCIDLIISRPSSAVVSEFLSIWVNSDYGKNQVLRRQGGLAQQHFNVGEMKNLFAILPSIIEQKLICERVYAIDNTIFSENENLEKLKQQKQGLMQDLLTGKVPVAV